MFSNIHDPTNVVFYRRIITVPSFSFPWRSWVNRWSIFYNGEETRRGDPSLFCSSPCSFIPTVLFRLAIPLLLAFLICRLLNKHFNLMLFLMGDSNWVTLLLRKIWNTCDNKVDCGISKSSKTEGGGGGTSGFAFLGAFGAIFSKSSWLMTLTL